MCTSFDHSLLVCLPIGLFSRIKKQCFRIIRKIPFIGGAVSISGDFVPSFYSWCALPFLSVSYESLFDDWIRARMGAENRPLAHLPSCTVDNSGLQQLALRIYRGPSQRPERTESLSCSQTLKGLNSLWSLSNTVWSDKFDYVDSCPWRIVEFTSIFILTMMLMSCDFIVNLRFH